MKKRALFVAVYACLLLCFLCGAAELIAARGERVSESENRMLQGMPKLSAEALLSGRYMDEMESYLSDAFFFRDETARFSERLMGFFALPEDGPDTGEIDQERLFAPSETPVPETPAPATPAPETPVPATPAPVATASEAPAPATSAPETPAPATSAPETPVPATPAPETPAPATPAPIDPATLSDGEFYLVDAQGNHIVINSYPAAQIAAFAELLNRYRAALPANGSLHFAVPPVAAVANNVIYSDSYTGWGSNLEDVLQPIVDEGVYIYDAADILQPYFGKERLYPVIDHHWQPVSASLVAGEMLRRQGVPPVDYYEYRYYVSTISSAKPFYGEELRGLSISVDAVEVMEPLSPVDAFMLRHLTERSPGVFIEKERGALLSYLGGLNGPWRLFDSGFHTGRTALVLGDSFELTFVPFLMPYYDRVLVTDLRDSLYTDDLSVRAYIEAYEVDDIYMLYSTYSPFCGEEVQSRLVKHLD